jgi:hypothetical protein
MATNASLIRAIRALYLCHQQRHRKMRHELPYWQRGLAILHRDLTNRVRTLFTLVRS